MPFEIFTDSSANLPVALAQARRIHIITYYYLLDGELFPCYREDVAFEEVAKKFYAQMREGAAATTSLITEERFVEALTPVLEEGKDALILTIASGLSGTFDQAVNAKRTLEAKFPARKVCVVDSANASLGQGLWALKAADLRDEGKTAEECARYLWENVYTMNSYVTVEDLKYLRRGGRISAVTAFAGTLLNIKPLIKADGGVRPQLEVYGKAHGRKKALSALVEAFDRLVLSPAEQTIAIAHADCEEEAKALAETLKAHGAKDILIDYYDICTGSHIGPNTVALFFLGPDRRTEEEKQNFFRRIKALFVRNEK